MKNFKITFLVFSSLFLAKQNSFAMEPPKESLEEHSPRIGNSIICEPPCKITEDNDFRRLHFEKIDSTQKYARRNFHNVKKDKWTLVTTEEQTDGVGQLTRVWDSPPLVNIYVTYILPWPKDSYYTTSLYQVSAISVSQTLEALNFKPTIKWANDVRLNEKKVSGILCETFTEEEGDTTLIGIGLNVNMPIEKCRELSQPVTSMSIEAGHSYDKEEVLKLLTTNLIRNIGELKNSGFRHFYSYVNEHLSYVGENIELQTLAGEKKGVFLGINHNGFMKFREDGTSHTQVLVSAGRIINKTN